MFLLPLELTAYDAGCSPMKRPAALDLILIAVFSFGVSALCAVVTDLIPWKLRELPPAMRWRARATVASLHQPLAVLYILPPSEALEIFLFTGGNQWTISAPRDLWLTMFYLLGAWLFELLILLHPATGAFKSYGQRGWSVQVAHHLGFPAFALHNIISGCAVPGTVVACYTELTVFFTSSFWIAKMAGAGEIVLLPIKAGMVLSTFVLRGACVLLLDLRAILNDQSSLPVASWLTQCLALVGTNVLNLLILRLVSGAVMRGSKAEPGWTAKVVERVLKLAMQHLGPGASERILLELTEDSADPADPRPSSVERLFQLFRQPPFLEEEGRAPLPNGPGPVAAAPAPEETMSREMLRKMMIRLAAESAGFAVEADKPLLDSGMDSKAAVQFSAKLAAELPGLRLPSTLVFDHPTLSAVAAYAEAAQRPKGPRGEQSKKPPLPATPSRSASSDPLAVIGTACAFPGDAGDVGGPAKFGALLASGTDGTVEVPFTRWELDDYYDPNPDAPGKMYPRHAAFIEGVEDFAAQYFGISAPEARAMDPQQRLVLETAHDALLDGAMKREALVGSSIAAIIGLSNNDWIQVQSGDIRKLNPYTATGTSASVSAARVAFSLGLKGPAYVVDTACSSALVAVDAAAMNLRRGRCTAAVSAAANVIASPATFISFSKPRMLSPRGRSHAFDASADGYGRGEGAGAVALCPLLEAQHLVRAALRGVAVNQDGRSSTMTAPNGPSQTMVVATALAEAKLQHHEVRHFEAHGTGTPLGDPIEVGALQAGSLDEGPRQQPAAVAAVKTEVGHLEGAAASPGLLKTIALLSHRAALAVVHLHTLNPHLTLLEDVPQVFPSEHFPLSQKRTPRTGGLSSFGFGGTNAHAVLGEAEQSEQSELVDFLRVRPEYVKKPFPWRDPGYRLLRRQDGESFEVPMSSDVYDTVSHHVVFGSIVTPGVVYVEMALEATRKLFGHKTQLRDVTMVFPFVVPDRFASEEPAPSMRFVLKSNTRFEIQSTNAQGKTTVHVEASLDHGASGASGAKSAPLANGSASHVDLAALRHRITDVVETKVVYEAIHSVGLYLGPMFQVARELWRHEGEAGSEVLARLQLNPHVKNVGYIMHPALLDGTIHILATASIGKDVSGLKIFGGVGKVSVVRQENFSKLSNYWVHLCVTESLEASQTFNVSVLADDGALLMSMEDVVFRAVKPEQIQMAIAAQGGKEDQKIYDVEWSEWSIDPADSSSTSSTSSTPSSKLLAVADTSDLHRALSTLDTPPECTLMLDALEIDEADLSNRFSRILLVFGSSNHGSVLEGLMAVLGLLQKLAKKKGDLPELWLATVRCQWTQTGDFSGQALPLHSAIWGLARTARNELLNLQIFAVDLEGPTELKALQAHLTSGSTSASEAERALRVKEKGEKALVLVPRLEEARLEPASPSDWSPQEGRGTSVITGGLGALGLSFASWLLEHKVDVALVSRSGRPPDDCKVAFRRLASKVSVHKADITSASDTERLLRALAKSGQSGRIRGILHAAGVLEDNMITDLTKEHFERVLGPKINGTLNLSQALDGLGKDGKDLDFFVLFSSVAALLGTPAQGNYSAGNAFMDSFAAHARENGRPAVSVQWGPWAEGMAARANTSESSIARLSSAKGLEAMQAILASQSSLRSGVLAVARFKWSALLGQLPRVPAFLSKFSVTKSSREMSNYSIEDVRSLVVDSLTDALGTDDFDINTPLMELGLDSLAGVEFRNRLQASVDGINLTPTLMFDYPTVPDLVDYIWSQVGPAEEEELVAVQAGAVGSQLAVAGHSGRFPGSLSNHPGDFWRTLSSGLDTTADLPPERWDMDEFFDLDVDTPGKTYVRLGHFILGIEQFDGEFFGLSEMEQRGMDPHQWLTLEITYDSMYAAGLTKETMNGLECGIYVGCATLGGISPDIPAFGPFTNIGYAYSGLSGRVSHTLSLRGPCFTVDTACSATVVALDCASQAIRLGRCRSAAASGVNLQLSAAIWVGFAKMRGLAMDGNCKTFDTSADGFARGEGMGSVYVAMADAAAAPAALLGGVATNHDGRAATITAPNGTAQQRVIRAALAERATRPEALGCLECHGTGTALGDPIEVGAQKAVYGKGRDLPMVLAAGKTNLGHLEGAAGVAGLSKAVLLLQKAQVTPLLWLKQLNHNVELSNFGFAPTELLNATGAEPRAAVSSFGFSGTNGHAILEVYQSTEGEPGERPRPTASYSRRQLQPYRQWIKEICFDEVWQSAEKADQQPPGQLFLVGCGPVFDALAPTAVGSLEGTKGRDQIAEALAETQAKTAVFVGSCGEVPEQPLVQLLNFLQALQITPVETAVVVTVLKGKGMESTQALWGLARSARLEMRSEIRLLECCEQESAAAAGALRQLLSGPEMELSIRQGKAEAPRLQRSSTVACTALQTRDMLQGQSHFTGPVLVTGGLGGLGLLAAQQLAELGAKALVLASRSGRAANPAALARLELSKAVVEVQKCDVSRGEEVAAMAERLNGELQAVIHAAGVLDRCVLKDLTSSRLDVTMGPKANGAWHVQSLSERLVLFSSVSAFLGLSGGAAYAAANAYLDALAAWRKTQGVGAVSVRFGPVADVGMAAGSHSPSELKSTALSSLPLAQVTSALRLLMSPQPLSWTPITLARADWSAYFRQSAGLAPMLQDFKETQVAAASAAVEQSHLAHLPASEREKQVLVAIQEAASSMHLEIQEDTPLMEAGIDSLSAVEFRGKISTEFRSVRLPSTLMFDHPTLKAIAHHISDELGGTAASPAQVPSPSTATKNLESLQALEVRGAACALPAPGTPFGGLVCSLWYGTDCISEMPYSRWDVEEYYDAEAPTGLEMYVRHAAFIEGVELFAAQFFGIGKVEAEAMDPQQRHLLETSFGAFGDAGYSRAQLMGLGAGVFVGQDKSDWNRMLSAAHAGPFAATGGSASISSNRISYSLGLKGPSATVDTACSSSLVAADTAAATIRRGRCELAAVCGVNMLLLPQTFIACCQARMLSADGRCHTFDASASGYTRGEGCGAQILGPSGTASGAASPVAAFAGSALNQDGRSANLTSPNGPSQKAVIQVALSEAGLQPEQVGQVETHGTGTELGDPIETGALRAALQPQSGRRTPVVLGAIKSNLGHLEGGAGMAGLLKLASQLQRPVPAIASNLHLRRLNAHIAEDAHDFAALFVNSSSLAGQATSPAASVSSFGFGGTNGHVVLKPKLQDKVRQPLNDLGRERFGWREPTHPLIRQKAKREDGVHVLSCPIDGHVLELLSHHIVHGEVVVPGACYLEMILAGVRAHLGQQEAWWIESLGFAKPLVLRLSQSGQLEEPVELRLLIWEDGRLEVESAVGEDPEDLIVSTHVEASLIQQKGGWTTLAEMDKQDLTQLRQSCPEEVDVDLMYSFGVKSGLPLQRRFRCVRQVQVQKSERKGFARLEMERDGTEVGFLLGPSLIDSSFQALMALADPSVGIGSLKIPLSIKRLQPTGRAYAIGVWSHFQLLDWTEHSTAFRCWLLNDAGETVLYFDSVHLQEVRDEHLQKVLQASGRLGAEQQALYSTLWRALPEQTAPQTPEASRKWLVLGRRDAIRMSALEAFRCVAHEDLNFQNETALQETIRDAEALVFVGLHQGPVTTCVEHGTDDVDVLALALHVLRAALSAGLPLVIVTRRTQQLSGEDQEPVHAGLWGFARSARLEEPERLRVACLDLDLESEPLEAIDAALAQLSKEASREEELSWRAGEALGRRLARSELHARTPLRLNMPARGALTGLRPVPLSTKPPLHLGAALLRVRAVGLNFRDVLNVMGLYPGDPGPPGADVGGTVLDLAEHTGSHLRLTEEVFGEAPGCLSSYCLAPAPLLAPKPPSWSFEEACAMPVIFVTVEEALGDLARLKRGERVLIHAAAGGVGLVAIQYAQHVGAEVYATAGSEAKHEYLRSIGVKHITSSRSGARFEEEMRSFLDKEGVDGIDVVLNSLSHDDYIPRSLAFLRSGGRFIEIGKRGIWSHQQMWESRPDVMYEKIAADTMMEKEPWRYNSYLTRLKDRVDAGGLKPIHMHVFEGLEEGVRALQFLQRAQNIGKVVLSEPSKLPAEGTHVLSGGTGALGVVTAQFLAEEGAKSLCLLSRAGRPPEEVQARWDWLQASTVDLQVLRCDVSEEASVSSAKVLKGPVASLFHLAGALADAMLPALDHEMFRKSYGPKVHGLRHLLRHLIGDSAQLVLFSSTSSLFGAPGQGNYAAANSTLDAFAAFADSPSRGAVSVQWGPWAEVGMAVQKGTVQRAKASGIGALSNPQGLAILGSVLHQSGPRHSLVGAAHVRWPKFLRTVFNAEPPASLLDMAAEAAKSMETGSADAGLAVELAALGAAERQERLELLVRKLASDVVGEDLPGDVELLESGMDSLSGVEFRNRLQQELGGVRLPNSAVFDFPTANALAGFIAGQLGARQVSEAPQQAPAGQSKILELLNTRTTGQPLFLVPGAGLQAAGFQALASLLPVPTWSVSWPQNLPRERWPDSLEALAQLLLAEVRAVEPTKPLLLAGHSFGATVCLEMARQAEASGQAVALVALLDPRTLLPLEGDAGDVFESGLLDTLAMLSQSVADGARYAAVVEEALASTSDDPEALRQLLGPAASALEHVHETFRWYAGLLTNARPDDTPLQARLLWVRAAEAWRDAADTDTPAKKIVSRVQAAVFQEDASVADHLRLMGASGAAAAEAAVPASGDHFAMLHEPHVVPLALRLCHAMVEASEVVQDEVGA